MTTQESDRVLDGLIDSARRAMRGGRDDEAARLWQHVLQLSPEHAHALLFFGQRTMRSGDARSALELLRRAAASDAKDEMIQVAIATGCRKVGDINGETAALDRSLEIDPYCLPALLFKGRLLAGQGKKRKATIVYQNALKTLRHEEYLPADLKQAVADARRLVADNSLHLTSYLNGRLGTIRQSRSGLGERAEMCVEIATGTKKAYTPEPVGLHFPSLPAIQFFETSQFSWVAELESQTEIIATELRSLLGTELADFKPYVTHPKGVPLNQWADLNHSPRWSVYFLWKDGVRESSHCERCPITAKILEGLPLADFPGAAPTAFFSALEPHTRIPPHAGVTNTRVIVHLPLIVPGHCGFRVGNDSRKWEVGKALVFDDTIEHEAWNDSDDLRIVLIFDIWNPFLTSVERETARILTSALRDYYREEA